MSASEEKMKKIKKKKQLNTMTLERKHWIFLKITLEAATYCNENYNHTRGWLIGEIKRRLKL